MPTDDLSPAAEAFLDQWGPGMQQDPGLRADLAALLETARQQERERAAAHIDVDFSRTGREFAAAIREMK